MRRHHGFALLTVLWLTTTVAVVVVAAVLSARDGVAMAANRVRSERAVWYVNGCLDRARASLDAALAAARRNGSDIGVWRRLDLYLPDAAVSCRLDLRAAGSRMDLNTARPDLIARLLERLHFNDAAALASALVDWRDADDVPLPDGAEHAWYAEHRRHMPRNGPLADARELSRVRGFETLDNLDSLLGIDAGRIAINSAPIAVLRVVPGFTDELMARIASDRDAGLQVVDILALAAAVSPAASDSVVANYPEIVKLTTTTPDWWTLSARTVRAPDVVAEVRLVPGDGRAIVTRRIARY